MEGHLPSQWPFRCPLHRQRGITGILDENRELFLLAFPRVSQPKGDRKGCASIGPLDLAFYPNVLVVHDKVAVSTLWSNPHSRSLNNLEASLVFTCCTRKLHHSLFPPFLADVRSNPELWAAVMCEGDASCSVTTAYPPASSLTLSPRRTSLPLYFCNCSASSERITRQKVHEGCEVHCCVVRLCFGNDLVFAPNFWFVSGSDLSQCVPQLFCSCLRYRNFHGLWSRYRSTYQIVMFPWTESILCHMICVQMTLVLSFEDMSLKFERFDFVFSEWFRKLPSAAFCYHWASLGGVTLQNRNTRQSWFHVEYTLPFLRFE